MLTPLNGIDRLVAGTARVSEAVMERALGKAAWQVLRIAWGARDRKSGLTTITNPSIARGGSSGRWAPMSVSKVNKAMTRIATFALCENGVSPLKVAESNRPQTKNPVTKRPEKVGWTSKNVCVGQQRDDRKVFQRRFYGSYAEGEIGAPRILLVPVEAAALLRAAPRHGGPRKAGEGRVVGGARPGAGRPKGGGNVAGDFWRSDDVAWAPSPFQGSMNPFKTWQFPPLAIQQDGQTPPSKDSARGVDDLDPDPDLPLVSFPGSESAGCAVGCSPSAPDPELTATQDVVSADSLWARAVSLAASAVSMRAPVSVSAPAQDPHPHPEAQEPPHEVSDGAGLCLGGNPSTAPTFDLQEAGVPPEPSIRSVGGVVTIPRPQLLSPEMTSYERAKALAEAFLGVAAKKCPNAVGYLPFTRGSITQSKHYRMLLAAAETLIECKIAPVAWCLWSCDVWAEHVHGRRGQVPSVAFMFSPKRIRERRGWFASEEADYSYRRMLFPDEMRALSALQHRVAAAARRARTLDEAKRVVAEVIPPGVWEQAEDLARAAVKKAQREIDEKIRCGWIPW